MAPAATIERVITGLHRAVWAPETLPDALDALAAWVGVGAASLERFDLADGSVEIAGHRGLPDHVMAEYAEHYHQLSPRVSYTVAARCGEVLSDQLFAPGGTRSRSEFYAWLERTTDIAHTVGVKLRHEAGAMHLLGFHHHCANAYDPAVAARVRRVAPAVATVNHSLLQARTLCDLASARQSLLDSARDGIAALGGSARLIECNAAMRRMVERGVLFTLDQGCLVPRDGQLAGAFAAALAGAAQGLSDAIVLARGTADQAAVTFLPPEPGSPAQVRAIIVARPRAVAAGGDAQLRKLFGLTRAEARIAGAIANGASPHEIAAAHGIAVQTVRVHLRHIFAKTGTRGQADLAGLMATLGRG